MDGSGVRAVAARVGQVAQEIRSLSGAVGAVSGVDWNSTAAGLFRRRLGEEAEALRHAADSLDEAATAVRRHAAAVEGR